ncbi:hypothetical protein C8K30_1011020 [Promicromonospora sp. AC04]|uniref:hypothetical protein n=1 Tax=Promicromonospora sp. AC04 TaxID=2135723 RepID=UPI000D39913C|nr:hypothetical protein [Promicromonospora sp. AC04]PUB32494.1 hypothetical protein C8K30_1011020 [Promicromonospora sp. AC04]
MSSSMLIGTLAVPADRIEPPDFDHGRRTLEETDDVSQFTFDDPDNEIRDLLPDLHHTVEVTDDHGQPILAYAQQAGAAIIDSLEEALASNQTSFLVVAGYEIYFSAGRSWGGAPTDAADAMWDADKLPEPVLLAMGFIRDYSKPLARKNGNPGHVTDTDVVDAIALGLGTQPQWSGADELQWIADAVGAVRERPGSTEPAQYLRAFTEQHAFDPTSSDFLAQYVSHDAGTDNDRE